MSLLTVNAPSEWQALAVVPGRGVRTNASFQFIEVKGDSIKYIGPGEDDIQAAACRANRPVRPCPISRDLHHTLHTNSQNFSQSSTNLLSLLIPPSLGPHCMRPLLLRGRDRKQRQGLLYFYRIQRGRCVSEQVRKIKRFKMSPHR